MEIKLCSSYNEILALHKEIFGNDFPIASHYKKIKNSNNNILYYKLIDNNVDVGFSAIIDEKDNKNFYCWYGGVKLEFQGKGYISRFLDFILNLANSNNYKSVTFATTNERPHMLILGIKKGFEIYNIKVRENSKDNKIYFIYDLNFNDFETIDINCINSKMNKSDIEKMCVRINKECTSISFTNVISKKDLDIFEYIIAYLASLNYINNIIIDKESINIEISTILEKYNISYNNV